MKKVYFCNYPSKWWRFKYRFEGKEKLLSLGIYPDVSLAQARERHDAAASSWPMRLTQASIAKQKKATTAGHAANSFEVIAREWHIKFSTQWTPDHGARILARLEKDVSLGLGRRPIAEITAPELLIVLRRIESRGAIETAHRTQQAKLRTDFALRHCHRSCRA